MALPPRNDVDVFSNCLGFVGIPDGKKISGYNVLVGGGLGMTHGKTATFPRLADVIGFCNPDQVVQVAEEVVKIQRDYGDRSDRRHARLKYTIQDRGVDWFLNELNSRLGWNLSPPEILFLNPLKIDMVGVKTKMENGHLACLLKEAVCGINQERLFAKLRPLWIASSD